MSATFVDSALQAQGIVPTISHNDFLPLHFDDVHRPEAVTHALCDLVDSGEEAVTWQHSLPSSGVTDPKPVSVVRIEETRGLKKFFSNLAHDGRYVYGSFSEKETLDANRVFRVDLNSDKIDAYEELFNGENLFSDIHRIAVSQDKLCFYESPTILSYANRRMIYCTSKEKKNSVPAQTQPEFEAITFASDVRDFIDLKFIDNELYLFALTYAGWTNPR